MKRRIIKVLGAVVMIWLFCIIKCEINTILFGQEFEGEFVQSGMIVGNPIPKVLSYNNKRAKIYFVDKTGGDIMIFENEDGVWMLKEWETIWSKSGSADGFIWPYGR